MRVLHFFKTYLPYNLAGIPRVIWEIAQGTARHGVETDVLSLSRHPSPDVVPIGDHFVHEARLDLDVASTGLSFQAFALFAKLARNADVLHYHFPYPFADFVHFASGSKKPMAVTYHSDIVRQRFLSLAYRPLMHRFLNRADAIVATSPNYLASSDVLRRYASKTTVIPIALAPAAKPSNAVVDAWRMRLGPRFFLFVGALRYYKGLEFLIEAAILSGLPVVIAGAGDNAPALQAQAAGALNVIFLGQVSDDDKAALLALCHAFVLPSHVRTEAFGVALLEAAMAGKPMISCEIGTGTSYVNHHGETGLVVRPANGAALAQAMRTLWDDDEISTKMGAAAARRAARLFVADTMATDYTALYERLVARRG